MLLFEYCDPHSDNGIKPKSLLSANRPNASQPPPSFLSPPVARPFFPHFNQTTPTPNTSSTTKPSIQTHLNSSMHHDADDTAARIEKENGMGGDALAVATQSKPLPCCPPTPLIAIGRLYAPIPPGRLHISLEAMEAARALGLGPMLAAAIGATEDPEQFWKLASLTDPVTASALLQGTTSSCGKRVLFVEKGAAEGLARRKMQLVHVAERDHADGRKKQPRRKRKNEGNTAGAESDEEAASMIEKARNSVGRAVISMMDRLSLDAATRKAAGAMTTGATSSSENQIKRKPASTSRPSSSSGGKPQRLGGADVLNRSPALTFHLKPVSPLLLAPFGNKAASDPPRGRTPQKKGVVFANGKSNAFHDTDDSDDGTGNDKARRREEAKRPTSALSSISPDTAASSQPYLGAVAVRTALELLRTLPGEFLLLAGVADGKRGGSAQHTQSVPANHGGALFSSNTRHVPKVFSAADTLDGIRVHTLKGLEFLQQTGREGATVRFTPAFLSEATMHTFCRSMSAFIAANTLWQRKAARKALCHRLAAAAAVIANGSHPPGGGGGGGGTQGGDSDGDGFEEPPEVQEAIREMGSAIDMMSMEEGFGSEAPPVGPVGGLVSAGATLACGVITLLGPMVQRVGDTMDNIFLRLPGGSYLLGVPKLISSTESHSLQGMLLECKRFNETSAASRAQHSKHDNALGASEEERSSPSRDQHRDGGAVAAGSLDRTLVMASLWMAILSKMSLDFANSYFSDTRSAVQAATMNAALAHRAFAQSSPRTQQRRQNQQEQQRRRRRTNDGDEGEAPQIVASPSQHSASHDGSADFAHVLADVVTTLDYNGFSDVLPSEGSLAERRRAAKRLAPDDGFMGLGVHLEFDNTPGWSFPQRRAQGDGKNESGEKVEGQEGVFDCVGRGIVLVGSLDDVAQQRVGPMSKGGIEVSVEDGARYLL